jgi:2-keto-4-pentenoate hydratase/2-oxohepta-3-ene-1,7-dioic acid hydratase in catechol pathway
VKLVTYGTGGISRRVGALAHDGTVVVDLAAASEARYIKPDADFHSVQSMIEGGAVALDKARSLLERAPASAKRQRSDVTFYAPIERPIQMRDCLCFEGHLVNAFSRVADLKRLLQGQKDKDPQDANQAARVDGQALIPKVFYDRPIYYKANRFAVVGSGQDVKWPSYCEYLDFELEFGCYIGSQGTDISKQNATSHIYGYTIFNDFSARDTQAIEMTGQLGPAKSKDFDTANAMGPCLVTADELRDPYNLTMVARVNGEEWSRGNSSTMFWKFEDLIAHISKSETLYPGEFLGSGTVESGCGLEQMRFLADGDVVELEVESIGVLQNRVVRKQWHA